MTRNNKLTLAVRRALVLGAASAALIQPVYAADEATIQEVVVTGSRIAQPGLTSISPVTAVGAEQIKVEGITRIEDLINNLPQAFADFGGNVSNGATGAATVNLRNLGSQRTLVLVNSRRLMPGDPTQNGTASPDLNQIPSALIERVEVLTGGASAVYGADAVAGVVNFIMNDNFEGVRVDAQYSMYQHSQHSDAIADLVRARDFALPDSNVTDGKAKDITFIAGINTPDGRGNATVYVGYRELDALKQDQRDFSACSLGSGSAFSCAGSSTSATGRFITRSDSPFGEFDSTIGPDNRLRDFAATDQFNFAPDNFYQRPDERKTAGLFAHYDFSEKASVYTEFMFMDDRSLAQIAASGAFIGGGPGQPPFFGDQLINCDNPFLTPDELAAWCGGNPAAGDIFLNIGRRNVEGGPRVDDLRHTSFRGVVGLRGDFSDGWTYDVYGLYGTSILSERQNDLSASRVGKALNAVVDTLPGSPTLGQVVCRVNADVDLSNDDPACVPWNIFQIGGVTPAQLAYLTIPGLMEGSTTEQVLSGSISGDLGRYGLKLPTATDSLAFAFGAEYRSERSELQPDAAYQQNDLFGQGAPTLPTNGGFDVKEVFGELRVPILQEQTLAQTLSLETGYRYSDYNLGFDTDSYKLGLDWAPVDSVRLRGSYQRAVRSPNVQELFLQPRVQLNGTSDPCAGDLTNAITADDPTASFEQCANSGVTAAQYGRILSNPAGQYNGRVGGNPGLEPEEADTYSYGIVLTPSFLPSLSLSLDYYDIKVEKLIGQVGQDFILGQCLEGVTEFCSAVSRVPLNGSLWLGSTGFINDPIINTGSLQTKGIDAEANYRFDVGGAGQLAVTLIGTYTDAYMVEPLPGVPKFDCAGLYGTVCGVPIPEWRHKLRANWQTPWGLDLSLTWRHIDKVLVDGTNPDTGAQPVLATDRELGARNYIDVSASYSFTDVGVFSGLTGRLGINNIADKDPPLYGAANCIAVYCNGNTFPQLYDTLGRYLFVGLTADF
jgi:iron complex outermembrane receptor protein